MTRYTVIQTTEGLLDVFQLFDSETGVRRGPKRSDRSIVQASADRLNAELAKHTRRVIKGELVVGAEVEILGTGPGYETISTGVYLGVFLDHGVSYHMFKGGRIGDTPQGETGRHGFPVSQLRS